MNKTVYTADLVARGAIQKLKKALRREAALVGMAWHPQELRGTADPVRREVRIPVGARTLTLDLQGGAVDPPTHLAMLLILNEDLRRQD